MKFQVVVSQKAESDLRHYYSVAAEHAPDTAVRWLNRFEATLGTLESNPTRCPLAPENNLLEETIHQFFFGKRAGRFRVLFTIQDHRVLVLHIRRGSMGKATSADLLE